MLDRLFTADRLNAIINHPSVHPHVCGTIEGPLDMSATVADSANVLLMGEHGGFFYHMAQQGIFEVHSQVLPSGRGRWAMEAAQESLHWMFTRTTAIEVITRVAKGNYAALALAKACGMKPVTVIPNGWITLDGPKDATVLGLTIQDWLEKTNTLDARGAWVAKKWRNAPIGDGKALGALFEMMSHGQLAKAAIFTKRWVAITGVDLKVEPLTFEPPRLQIGNAIVVVRDDKHLSVIPLEATGTEETH
jgi:hypothetical protein